MEPFKNLIHPGLVDRMAAHLKRAHRRFDAGAPSGFAAMT